MKKAQMLKFLFYTILALVIFIPVIFFGCKLLNVASAKSSTSYYKLVEIVTSIKDGETLSMPFYMDKKSFIVGFSKESNRFENHVDVSTLSFFRDGVGENFFGGTLTYYFDRPESCKDSKACLCLCPDYDLKTINQFGFNPKPPYSNECERLTCKSVDNIDFLSERLIKSEDQPEYSWKGGFLYLRDLRTIMNGLFFGEYYSDGTGLLSQKGNTIATRTFYVQRYKDIVDVCLESPCITDEIKEQIDAYEDVEQSAPE